MKKASLYWPLILALACIKFTLPFFLQSPIFELQRDEYLYYQQGLHFDFGYLENPPLLSYLGMISSWLGGSIFWIKFWPCLFGSATLIITCLITAELGGKRFAQFLASLGIITGAYMRVHFLFQPNFLDIFFWTLSLYFIIRYINNKRINCLYWFAISIGLGFWGKYSVIFITGSILLSLLLSPHRKIFAEKKFYFAALITLLIILPNVWWQYSNNWPLVHHMKELQETQLRFTNPFDFLKSQLMMLIAVAVVWIAGLVWLLKQKQWRFLAYTYFFVIILLILGRGKNYYSLGIYPMLLAAGAVIWEQWTQKRYWIRYTVSILIIGFTWVILPMLLPTWQPEKLADFYKRNGIKHKWEDQKDHELPQDFADMLGWKELAEKSETFFNTLPDSTKSNTIIYCRNYGQAGSLKFYGKELYFKNKVISDNGSFLLWIPGRLWMKHLLFIGKQMPDNDDEVFQHLKR
ncbi:MAG: glycosyltransferase family 39 protein [Bacteroidota bacterium]